MRYVQITTIARANMYDTEREMINYLVIEHNETLKFLERASTESALQVLNQYGGGTVTSCEATWISEFEYKAWELKNKRFRAKKGAK